MRRPPVNAPNRQLAQRRSHLADHREISSSWRELGRKPVVVEPSCEKVGVGKAFDRIAGRPIRAGVDEVEPPLIH